MKNDIPGDLELLRPWFNLIRRVRQLALKTGCALTTITVVTDDCGNPVEPWILPELRKLEPSTTAEQAFEKLVKEINK